MNGKQQAARKAVELIEDGAAIGLGMGATMAYMVEFLHEQKKNDLQVYTSSAATKLLLEQNGFSVFRISEVSNLLIYFDGCDQFDKDLNALKSGGGIHTNEKLFASMADQFILVGDESKYAEHLDTTFPLA
ncbi:MAG: ribose-5-phosphate isomerase A, partial [Bacteroidota bacterium]|nr:ribose-5-phosphate isomerase A [Bacteroidota bacterium]